MTPEVAATAAPEAQVDGAPESHTQQLQSVIGY